MKGKLIKLNRGYYNLEDEKGNVIGTSYQFKSSVGDAIKYKLSLQNCDEIFGAIDVEKLAKEETRKYLPGCPENIMNFIAHERFFKIAFEKAMELYQPTEIEVEIVMDKIPADLAPGGWDVFPKLDSQECIILKRVV
jgi:hypothetical protein